ncbi:unnamed protein product [marine sediment metagenome]|uniref:Uncharacterized protein n=1 Tax=marine sediment metagenome TaxID=412755 RepID=X1RHI8_9ZZZZ
MRKGLLFKLVKWSRAIRIFFGGYTKMEEKHKLFELPYPLTPREIYKKLLDDCYQYNALSSTYKKQIFTVRKLTDIDHQIHLRFYSDTWVSGHYELQPEQWPVEHLQGKDLRSLNEGEIFKLKGQLGVPKTT